LELLQNLVVEGVHFVIRLNLGSQPPTFTDRDGTRVQLQIRPGKTEVYPQVFYREAVAVNVIGTWRTGFKQPLWVMTDLDPQRGLALYYERMKIEESFRDLKSLLHLDKLMNKQQTQMEKMVALVLLAFSLGVLVGEQTRDELYGLCADPPERLAQPIQDKPTLYQSRKWRLYSGLFILLKHKLDLTQDKIQRIFRAALAQFILLLRYPVRTPV